MRHSALYEALHINVMTFFSFSSHLFFGEWLLSTGSGNNTDLCFCFMNLKPFFNCNNLGILILPLSEVASSSVVFHDLAFSHVAMGKI